MFMAKRTQRQIELDCKRIQEAAKKAVSMKELGEITGLTQAEIRTSLSKHPIISKKVQKQVEENKLAADFEHSKSKKTMPKDEPNKANENPNTLGNNDYEMGFVIDTSMAGVEAIHELFSKIYATDAKIILTSVVRQELNVMQFAKKDLLAGQARRIMAMALGRPEKFCNVLIDETVGTHDDCIVKYCVDNKERVILLTADKNMALDAKEKSVEVEFFKGSFKHVRSLNNTMVPKKGNVNIRTLHPARKVGNKLLIMDMQGDRRDIRVWSNGREHVDGIVELKVGDDVYIAAKKNNGITFGHYKIITLYEEDNCKQVFFKKFHSYHEIEELTEGPYKVFAMAYWNKLGLIR